MIINILGKAIDLLKKNKTAVIIGASALTAATGTIGAASAIKGKKINKEAERIQQEAINRYNQEKLILEKTLESLGETKIEVIESFDTFCNIIESIQKKPNMRSLKISNYRFPKISISNFKKLSSDLEIICTTGGLSAASALPGLALFGASSLALVPAMITGGVVLCIKGIDLKKKAYINLKEAKQMNIQADEIIDYFKEIEDITSKHQEIISMVYKKYNKLLNETNKIIKEKTNYRDFNEKEKLCLENLIILARLLYKLCDVKIIEKTGESIDKEKINSEEIKQLHKAVQLQLIE